MTSTRLHELIAIKNELALIGKKLSRQQMFELQMLLEKHSRFNR